MTFEDPRRVLRRYGAQPNRAFSQNFLISAHVVERTVGALSLSPDSVVVEIGPGPGTLTRAVLQTRAQVVAIERDRAMIAILEQEFPSQANLEVRLGDATRTDYRALQQQYGRPLTVTGNLPYASTGAIFRNLTEHGEAIERAVVMVQREVSDRLTARPATAAYGALTVFVTSLFAVTRVLPVPPTAFFPRPAVNSAVVRLDALRPPRAAHTSSFQRVVSGAFRHRRKTLRNALLHAGLAAEHLDPSLAAAQIDGRRRGETLSVEEFERLARSLGE